MIKADVNFSGIFPGHPPGQPGSTETGLNTEPGDLQHIQPPALSNYEKLNHPYPDSFIQSGQKETKF
jgi:hypothetical protein